MLPAGYAAAYKKTDAAAEHCNICSQRTVFTRCRNAKTQKWCPQKKRRQILYCVLAIAERINRMIKHIRAGAYTDKRTAVVIDSMKNKYESNYLRDRYSAYYLFAVSRDETIRIHHLLQDQKKGLSQDEIEKIDLNERPDAVAGRFVRFVDILKNIV